MSGFDATLPDGSKVSGWYIRGGDQKIIVKDGEFNQQSSGDVPSGLLGLVLGLFEK